MPEDPGEKRFHASRAGSCDTFEATLGRTGAASDPE